MNATQVERVDTFRYLGVHITEDLTLANIHQRRRLGGMFIITEYSVIVHYLTRYYRTSTRPPFKVF